MHVISLVEKGWSRARRVAVQVAGPKGRIHHIVRGSMSAELVEVFTSLGGAKITGVSPRWYRAVVWLTLLQTRRRRQSAVILVDNERAGKWLQQWSPLRHARVLFLHETEETPPWSLQPEDVTTEAGRLVPVSAS